MAPPNPKRPSRPKPPDAATARPRRPATVELPFDDAQEVLDVDNPRLQRVAQSPSAPVAPRARRVAPEEEALPTTVYQVSRDEELPPTYDPNELSDPGFKPAFLYVEKGPGQGQLLPVKQGALVIGRASVSELRLQHPSVSRRHAQLTRLGERFYLKDLGSQNATFVNKVRIETEIEIFPGDQLSIGNALIKLRGPAEKVPEATRRQIDKAAAQSARRKATPQRSRAPRATARPANRLLLGLACAAIGFGLAAVLLFVALNILQREPAFEVLPSVAGTAPAVAVTPPLPTITVSEPQIETAAAPQARQPTAAPAVANAPGSKRSEDAAPNTAAAPQPRKVAPEEPKKAAAPEPKKIAAVTREAETMKSGAVSKAEVLKRYEAGDVAGAIELASSSGDASLTAQLTAFQTAYEDAQRAEKANDGAGAVNGYKAALAADQKLSGGWGKHGPAISKKLGLIYVLWGQQLLKEDNETDAVRAFKEALKHDPANGVARKHLASLAPSAAPVKKAAKRASIDDAFGEDSFDEEEEAAPPPPARKARQQQRSAIEDAWGD